MSPPTSVTAPSRFAVRSALPSRLAVSGSYNSWILSDRLWSDMLEAWKHLWGTKMRRYRGVISKGPGSLMIQVEPEQPGEAPTTPKVQVTGKLRLPAVESYRILGLCSGSAQVCTPSSQVNISSAAHVGRLKRNQRKRKLS
jgi:hypothetical protein